MIATSVRFSLVADDHNGEDHITREQPFGHLDDMRQHELKDSGDLEIQNAQKPEPASYLKRQTHLQDSLECRGDIRRYIPSY